jgi:CheY-like chemotaxis protein
VLQLAVLFAEILSYFYPLLLQVDKNIESRCMIEKFCLKKHATITMADSGDHALALLQETRFNIVIVDVDAVVSKAMHM